MQNLKCASPMCNLVVSFKASFPRADFSNRCEPVVVGTRTFCSNICRDDWVRTNNLIKFAAEGGPTLTRRPTRVRHWYERDG